MISSIMTTITFVLLGAFWMLILLGIGATVLMPGVDRWNRTYFLAFFGILTIYVGFTTSDEVLIRMGAPGDLMQVLYYFETLFGSLLLPMTTAYLLRCVGENWRQSGLFKAAVAIWLVFSVVLNLSLVSPHFYRIGDDGEFYRGLMYPLGIMALEAIVLLNIAGTIRWRDRLPRRYFVALLVGSVPMALVFPLQCVATVFLLIGFTVVLSAMAMYGIILSDEVERYMGQQKEIAHQRASIMVLQMRPHFIYNTMMSIYYLCRQDPDLAQQVTLDFTTYLRKNFTAIASEDLIPFSEELEHTRAYLAVERAQFEDTLVVDIDAPHTDFLVPPLTLQPIVENAVKHGMDPDSVLRVSIRTESSADGSSRIVVENTGADFAPADDGGPHTALANIRQRLEMMCDGTMAIVPREGGGTVVTVTVRPKRQRQS